MYIIQKQTPQMVLFLFWSEFVSLYKSNQVTTLESDYTRTLDILDHTILHSILH